MPCLLKWPMAKILFFRGQLYQVFLCDRLRYDAIQVIFGLKIANVELNTLFNYFNPSRVYPNNAMSQVLIL